MIEMGACCYNELVKIIKSMFAENGKMLKLKVKGCYFELEQDDIIYICSHAGEIEIKTSKKSYYQWMSLNAIGSELGDNFIKVSRDYIINIKYVTCYRAGVITLNSDICIKMPKRKKTEFDIILMEYEKNCK